MRLPFFFHLPQRRLDATSVGRWAWHPLTPSLCSAGTHFWKPHSLQSFYSLDCFVIARPTFWLDVDLSKGICAEWTNKIRSTQTFLAQLLSFSWNHDIFSQLLFRAPNWNNHELSLKHEKLPLSHSLLHYFLNGWIFLIIPITLSMFWISPSL